MANAEKDFRELAGRIYDLDTEVYEALGPLLDVYLMVVESVW